MKSTGVKPGAEARPGQERRMNEFLAVAKALSDENRVRVLMFLGEDELCVCQIIEMLGLAPSTISEHMAVLHRAGLVQARKEGRWIYYRLAAAGESPLTRDALRWVKDSLDNADRIRADARRLRAVKRTPVKELCRCYKA
jgi:DNA-binding transcriptional ArsR family regulator